MKTEKDLIKFAAETVDLIILRKLVADKKLPPSIDDELKRLIYARDLLAEIADDYAMALQ